MTHISDLLLALLALLAIAMIGAMVVDLFKLPDVDPDEELKAW